MRRFGILTGCSLLLWLGLAYPARLLGGDGIFLSGVAMLLCLVPALITLAWAGRAGKSPEAQLLVVLGGTGFRIVAVVGGAGLLCLVFPEHFHGAFWLWLVIFYLVILALEVTLLVRRPMMNDE